MNEFTTHSIHRQIEHLRAEEQRLQGLLHTTNGVLDLARKILPQNRLSNQIYNTRRILQDTPQALYLVQRQIELLEKLVYAFEVQGARNLLVKANQQTLLYLATIAARLLGVGDAKRIIESLERFFDSLADKPPASPPPAATRSQALVRHISDGDTVVLAGGERLRYIGIDTPEMRGLNGAPEPFAREALALNQSLVEGKLVTLRRDRSNTDRFGRLLRYVYVGQTFVNAELVRQGLAYTLIMKPDLQQADLLRRLEKEARAARRGIWGKFD